MNAASTAWPESQEAFWSWQMEAACLRVDPAQAQADYRRALRRFMPSA